MKKIVYTLGIIALMMIFTGCSVKNDFNVVLPENYKAAKQHDYKLATVNVQLATESQKTGDLDVFSDTYALSFQNALTKVLNDTKAFSDSSKFSVQVKATVLKNDGPTFGLDMTVYTDVSYEVKNQDGKIVYSKIITSQGLATGGEKFVALERITLATDRAVQNNIKLFIADIESLSF